MLYSIDSFLPVFLIHNMHSGNKGGERFSTSPVAPTLPPGSLLLTDYSVIHKIYPVAGGPFLHTHKNKKIFSFFYTIFPSPLSFFSHEDLIGPYTTSNPESKVLYRKIGGHLRRNAKGQ